MKSIKQLLVLLSLIFVLVFLFACKKNEPAATGGKPEPTLTATATAAATLSPVTTPSLTMDQKVALVWMGDDYQTCYATDVYIFSDTVNGKSRLIWTCLEDKQTNKIYSLYFPFSTTELCAYDLFNREYLFTLKLPQDALQTDQMDLYKYITDLSPTLSNATFNSSMNLLNLDVLYSIEGIYSDEMQDVGALINSYIYIEPNTIDSWGKRKAIEVYFAVTPERYILPYWEYVPDTVMPADFYSEDAAGSEPAVAYTTEQKELMLGLVPDNYPYIEGNVNVFFLKVNGNNRVIWTCSTIRERDKDDADNVITDVYSIFNQEYLFSLSYPQNEYSQGIAIINIWQYHSSSSDMLEGMELMGSCTLTDLPRFYSNWGIDYQANEYIDSIVKSFSEGDFSYQDIYLRQQDIAAFYLETLPDQYIMPFWEYVPEAQVPEELKQYFPG